jgi:hypothetical protein
MDHVKLLARPASLFYARVERRWGPYLRMRWREGARKRMKYIGKLPSP